MREGVIDQLVEERIQTLEIEFSAMGGQSIQKAE
jgi:hypothetical protein